MPKEVTGLGQEKGLIEKSGGERSLALTRALFT